jgi:LIM homeobox protein 3/4
MVISTLGLAHRRAKEKRLKKDAGRTRWSQYFRSIKGSGAGSSSPRSDKMDTKDSEREIIDSNYSHGSLFFAFSKYFNF